MNSNAQRRPAEIQAEIDRTRGAMDGTLRQIEQRLTPGQLMDQGLSYLRSSGASEFVSNLGGSVKDNPLPVALVGIGLAWLMASGRNGGYSASSSSSLSSSLGSARQQAGEKLQSARDKVSQLGDRASDLTQSAREQMQRAKGGLDTMIEEQPLALGAIGLAIGAVLAAAAPRTRQEDRIMGEASDRLKEQAKETAKQQAEVLQDKAQKIEQSAKPKSDGSGSASVSTPASASMPH